MLHERNELILLLLDYVEVPISQRKTAIFFCVHQMHMYKIIILIPVQIDCSPPIQYISFWKLRYGYYCR